MKKSLLIKIWATLLPLVVSSCGSNGRNEDSLITEDYFEVGVLEPSDAVKKTIANVFSSLFRIDPLCNKDSICLKIECNAIWNVANNEDPSSIRVIGMDTTWFYLTIDEGSDSELTMNWNRPTERPILRTIKTILDTGTFSLYCINHDDVSPQRLLDAYINSVAETEIYLTMCIRNGNWNKSPQNEGNK